MIILARFTRLHPVDLSTITHPRAVPIRSLSRHANLQSTRCRRNETTMGSSDSKLRPSKRPADEVTTVKGRDEEVDPCLERLKALKISSPILKSPPTESTLTDILVRKPSSASTSGSVNPKIVFELLSLYREWQEDIAKRINQNQEELENKIEIADAVAVKLLQRFNYSVSVMKTAATHFEDVHPLQVEVGELKGKLKEVLANYDALCKRISAEGPDVLRDSVTPFPMNDLQFGGSSALQRAPHSLSTRT